MIFTLLDVELINWSSYIFLFAEVVWDFLKRLRIKVGDVPDPVFGDVKKILTKDCVHMLYLQYVRREGTDPPVYEFSSGPRADAEIPKRKLLEFVCKSPKRGSEVQTIHFGRRRQAVCVELIHNTAPGILGDSSSPPVSQWDKCLNSQGQVYGNSESDWPVQAKQLEQAEQADSAEGQRLSQ
ncbi:Uncharacterized protein GBIM_19369, partial [Gryllus bimaculatus]